MIKKSAYNLALITLIFALSAYIYDFYENSLIASRNRFGVSYMTMNNSFYTLIQNSLSTEIEGHGDELILRDPVLDADKQIEEVEEFIKMDVDGIFLNPVDSEKIIPVLEKAADKEIPVIIIDSAVDPTDAVICSVYSDNYEAGVLCAKNLMENSQSAKIMLLEHSLVKSGAERIQGFIDTLASHPEYEIVARGQCRGQTEEARPVAGKLLQENPEIDTIMALNDPAAIGAIAAIEYLDLKDIKVYSVDGTAEFKELLKTGSAAEATVAQDPSQMGKEAAQAMYSTLEGNKVPKEIFTPIKFLSRKEFYES